MATNTFQTRDHLQQELINRLELQPVDTWPPHRLRFVLNATDLEAEGELQDVLHVPTATHPTMTIQLDTTGLDLDL
jgi:hypothetical protein